MNNNTKIFAGLAIIIIAIVGILLLSGPSGTQTTSISIGTGGPGTGNLSVQLTDPPSVPAGTQALIITYTGVGLHETGAANSTGYVDFAASGTVNLLNLANVSQTIAVVRTEANQSFNMIRFDVNSATITIDNVTYNVTVPSGGVVAGINSSISASSSGGVVIDLSPTIIQAYTAANQSVFVMVPSARAVAIGKATLNANTGLHVGATAVLPTPIKTVINNQRPNISMTGTASEAGNLTQISVTVKNNGNSSVLLSDVAVRGYMEAIPTYGSWVPPPGVTISTMVPAVPPAITASAALGTETPVSSVQLNSSLNSTLITDMNSGASVNGQVSPSAQIGIGAAEIFYRDFHDQLNFIVESNGSLQLPFAVAMVACPAIIVSGNNGSVTGTVCQPQSFGYTLAPGASVVLSYSGVISFPNIGVTVSPVGVSGGSGGGTGASASAIIYPGPRVGSAEIVLIPNQTYRIVVHGEHGAYASTSVVATGYITNYRPKIVDVTSVDVGLHNVVTGTTYNETMAGFFVRANSTVDYSIYSYGGIYATALPTNPYNYGLNVTGFQVNTPGFTLLNYSVRYTPQPECPVCKPGTACPDYCLAGTGKLYLLHIKVPQTSYIGALSITEDYNSAFNTTT